MSKIYQYLNLNLENVLIIAMVTEYVHLVDAYVMEIIMVQTVKFLNGLIMSSAVINALLIKVYVL